MGSTPLQPTKQRRKSFPPTFRRTIIYLFTSTYSVAPTPSSNTDHRSSTPTSQRTPGSSPSDDDGERGQRCGSDTGSWWWWRGAEGKGQAVKFATCSFGEAGDSTGDE